MGGAQIYTQAEPLARRVVVTEIAYAYEGDAFATVLGSEWCETAREKHVAASGLDFSSVTYERQPPVQVIRAALDAKDRPYRIRPHTGSRRASAQTGESPVIPAVHPPPGRLPSTCAPASF